MEQEIIIRKIKGLLAKAEDKANDEECQAALVMAKRWMVKYHITRSDLVDHELGEKVIREFENFEWWEEILGALIAQEFRVRAFYKLSQGNTPQTSLYYYGLLKDLTYAHSVFNLAYEGMGTFIHLHQKKLIHLDKIQQKQSINDYISGFLHGLQEKFMKQSTQIKAIASKELMLVLDVPKQVQEQFTIKSQNYQANCLKLPEVKDLSTYQKGKQDSELMTLDLKPHIEGGNS
jgi:Protein of unknown function (DUF2786).